MKKTLGLILGIAVVASTGLPGPTEVQARDLAKKRSCGAPARSFNQCLVVCSCMGGTRCYASCGTKDYSSKTGAEKRGSAKRFKR